MPTPSLVNALPANMPSRRLVGPDLARGLMLLLIALANVRYWPFGEPLEDHTAFAGYWTSIRAYWVDQRSLPLFAMLFGAGLTIISSGVISRGGTVKQASRTLMWRGVILLCFGAIHAAAFHGDILGSYGLLAIVLAPLIARRKWGWLALIGAASLACGFVLGLDFDALGLTGDEGVGGDDALDLSEDESLDEETVSSPLANWAVWLENLLLLFPLGFEVPAAVVGMVFARTGLFLRSHQHRIALLGCTLFCVPVGGIGGWAVHHYTLTTELGLLFSTGIIGAFGYLTFLLWWGSWLRYDDAPTWRSAPQFRGRSGVVTRFFTAIGKRSLSCYLGQTVVFLAATLGVTQLGCDVTGDGSVFFQFGVAVIAWLLCGALALWLDMCGKEGPAEVLMHRLRRKLAPVKGH